MIPKLPSLFVTLGPGALSGQLFAALCDQLLIRDTESRNVEFWTPSDRAGDYRGLDSFVIADARTGSSFAGNTGKIGLQYKFYASETVPLSSDHKHSIKNSLNNAAEQNPDMSVWILVTPEDFNVHQLEWLQSLAHSNDKLKILHWGQKKLTSLITQYPECAAHIYPVLSHGKRIPNWREYCLQVMQNHYVDPAHVQLSTTVGDDVARVLEDFVQRSDGRMLCLLGSYGAGKTTSLQGFATLMAENFVQRRSHWIPIFVKLRYVRGSKSFRYNLLDYLSGEYGIRLDILALKAEVGMGRLLLIFDGLDEKEDTDNRNLARLRLAEVYEFLSPVGKMIVSSRTEFFFDALDERSALLPPGRAEVLRISPTVGFGENARSIESTEQSAEVIYIAPITPAQAQSYLQSKLQANFETVRPVLMATYDIPDLIKTPLFLNLVSETAPALVRSDRDIAIVDVYETYIRTKLEQDVVSGRISFDIEERLDAIERLAEMMLRSGEYRIHYSRLDSKITGKTVGNERDFLSTAFLVRDGRGYYEFSHRSFLEFFGARRLKRALSGSVETDMWDRLGSASGNQLFYLDEMIEQAMAERTARGSPGDPPLHSWSAPVRDAQYRAFMMASGYRPRSKPFSTLGFASVTYYDAVAYALFFSTRIAQFRELRAWLRPAHQGEDYPEEMIFGFGLNDESIYDSHLSTHTEQSDEGLIFICGTPEWCLGRVQISPASNDPEHPRGMLKYDLSATMAAQAHGVFRVGQGPVAGLD